MTELGLRYVSDEGNDSNDGLSWATAKRSPQAAYNDVSGPVTVFLAPRGRYDVGDGLALARNKTGVFTSWRDHRRGPWNASVNRDSATLWSSTGAQRLVTFDYPNVLHNGYGFEFANLNFEISQTTEIVFDAVAMNDMLIDNCGAAPPDWWPEMDFVFVRAHHNTPIGDDSSWFRISRNHIAGGGRLIDATGWNVNQWVIRENKVYRTQVF